MERKGKHKGADRLLYLISWFLLGIILSVFFIPLLLPGKYCFNSTDYAIYVGGLAGPLAALVGFIYVYLTFVGQQRQLNEQSERMDKEEASKEFTEYLNLWNEFRAKVIYGRKLSPGSEAINSYWENVRDSVINDSNLEPFNLMNPSEFKISLHRHLKTSDFNKDSGQYEDFIRMAYPLIEIADKGKLDSRLKYLENLLSDGEKAILVYSATFLDEKDFAIRLFKKGFCKSLPEEYLISPDHKKIIF